MPIRILISLSWLAFLVSFLIPVTPAWSERIWDDELNRYLTSKELIQEDVYLTNEDAARLMFPESEKIRYEVVTLTPDQKTLVEQRIKWRFPEEFFDQELASLPCDDQG